MKKNLLLTTALVSAAFAFSANAWAEETRQVVKPGDELSITGGKYENKETTKGKPGTVFHVSKPDKDGKRGKLTITGGTFSYNFAETDGGAIGNYGDLVIKNTVFERNAAGYKKSGITSTDNNPIGGGALSLGIDSHTIIDGARFTHNTSEYNGGAIATRRTLTSAEETTMPSHSLDIKNSIFENNMAFGALKDSGNGTKAGGLGGAIATTFENTNITGSTFNNNFSNNGGGAIYVRDFIKTSSGAETSKGGALTVTGSNFNNNNTWGEGGAIYTSRNSHELTVKDSTFDGNTALYAAGAIWSGSKTHITNGTFTNNKVTDTNHFSSQKKINTSIDGGGAIFVGSASDTTIENSTFEGNTSTVDGGAIATRKDWKSESNGGQLTSNTTGKLTIRNSNFTNNHAGHEKNKYDGNGGAISNTFETASIEGGLFSGNTAQLNGGAIANFAGASGNGDTFKGLTVKGATFEKNSATQNGGAIFNGGYDNHNAAVMVEDSDFIGNTAHSGGAIYSGSGDGASVSVKGGIFSGNSTTDGNGGAIFSGGVNKLTVDGATFEGNHAKGNGGAISLAGTKENTITDTTFRNNSAEGKGGALNITGANDDKVTFDGDVIFEGNYVTDKDGNKTLNDIYFGDNKGTITVKDGALLSLDGGITVNNATSNSGNGAKLTLEKGSTLSVNNETVIESTVFVNGSSSSSENARLKLRLAADSDNVFDLKKNIKGFESGSISSLDVDTTNNLYNITGKDGVYTATQKSADEVASKLGVKESDAGTVLGMMNIKSTNERFTKVQDTLAFIAQDDEVDSKEISRAADALGADAAPVVQTRETALSNMIFDAASDALDDNLTNAAVGQSSGDSLLDKAKVWVKGLFNYADRDETSKARGFDIDTYGVAMGADKEIGAGKVGLGYAYSQSDINGYTRDTDVDTHSLFLYGQYKPADWYVKGVAAYSWSDYEEKKSVLGHDAKAKYDVDTLALQGLYGYNFHLGDGYDITPEGGLRYLHASQDSYTNGLGVRVKDRDIDVLTAVAGVKAAKNFALSNGMNIRPEVRAALTYDLSTDDNESSVVLANGQAIKVDGEELDRFGFEFGAKLATDITSNWEVAAGYEGKFREDYQDHTGILSAKYKF